MLTRLGICLLLAACGDDSTASIDAPLPDAGTVDSGAADARPAPDAADGLGQLWVTFDTGQPPSGAGVRARGVYIWIEDASGNYVDTVQQYFGRVQATTAPGCPAGSLFYSCSGYRYYDDACFDYHAACAETGPLDSDPSETVNPTVTGTALSVDGVSGPSAIPAGATMPTASGTVTSAIWDCVDHLGVPVAAGNYTVEMEITWERADGLGHRRPCEAYPTEFPECSFRYSATIAVGAAPATATLSPSDWMASTGTVHFTP